ncbi:MAG: sigma-70 family RNA polymerase sigma factor [Clostridia bacterium]|nr:sigma-70 family RNA polymerase sigma factor [Clostridia bacterium]
MEDRKIVELFWLRDESAINQTKQKYSAMLNSIAFSILKNKSDAEECENDTYLAAWNSMPENRPEYLGAYLGRIIKNISVIKIRQRTARKRGNGYEECIDELSSLSTPETTESLFDEKETARHISDFLRSLDAEKRHIFIRRYWYCDSIRDISQGFDISESKVKTTLSRIRQKLKEYLICQGVEV